MDEQKHAGPPQRWLISSEDNAGTMKHFHIMKDVLVDLYRYGHNI